MNYPLITIFIPTYKRPHLLKKTLKSALEQTYKDLCILVCDNASDDETPQVIAEFMQQDSRILYVRHEKNRGMLGNYIFGISQIKTEFFVIVSDDDILLPHFCETALKGFSEFPDIAFFAASTLMATKQSGIFRVPLEKWPREGLFSSEEGLPLMIGKYPVPITVLIRTKALSNVAIDIENPVAWDCDLLIQLAGQFPFMISKKPCGIYVSHPHSFSGVLTFEKSLESILKLIKRVQGFPWLKNSIKAKTVSQLKKDFIKTALIQISFIFDMKSFKKCCKTCGHLIFRLNLNKIILLYFALSFVCIFIPRMHVHFMKFLRKHKLAYRNEAQVLREKPQISKKIQEFESLVFNLMS